MLTSCYPLLIGIHTILRWSILLSGVVVISACITGIKGRKSFAPLGRITGIVYLSFLDTQFLIGILLSIASPLVQAFLTSPALGMKNHDLRFFAVEHSLTMLIALALAHIGAVKSRKTGDPIRAYKAALTWYALSLILILTGIPWWRPLLRI